MTKPAKNSETEPEPETVRVIGRVKWFDPAKGYGFVVPSSASDPSLQGDVLLHVSTLRKYGESLADEDSNIVCDVARGERGWQCVNVIEMDPPRVALAKTAGDEAALEVVTVKWYNRTKGYGFVQTAQSEEDIFVHAVVLRDGGLEEVSPGDQLLANIQQGGKGKHVAVAKPLTSNS